jgi:hypothetical protein
MHYDILKNQSFWRKYVERDLDICFDGTPSIRNTSWQEYELANVEGPTRIKSMLTIFEAAVLFATAKDYFSGQGEIVDLGALTGLSTNALARRLKLNTSVRSEYKYKRIYSYDLFLTNPYYREYANSDTAQTSGSLFNDYLEANKDFLQLICPCPGDLLGTQWSNKSIEILFIDLAKSWDLNNFILKQMFPMLIPRQSVVFHQDYVHFNEYWIHITMEYLSEYFDFLFTVYGATVAYGLKKSIPLDLCNLDLRTLPIERKSELMTSAIEKAPVTAREVLKTAHAKCLYDHQCYEEAIDMLRSVNWASQTNDPAQDFSSIAQSNAKIVADLVKIACGKSAF